MARSRRIDLVGRDDLLTCYAALKRARLFIGNDTGFMHLAAAAGAPTLGLFGPSDDAPLATLGRGWRAAVRGARTLEEFRQARP